MKISYNWLKEFIPGLKPTSEEVAERLSNTLAEVEKVETVGNDYVLEIENKALSHRADLFSEIGFAREVSACFNTPISIDFAKPFDNPIGKIDSSTIVNIPLQNPKLSQRYSAVIIRDIKVEESPDWLKEKIISVGLRPISNIVDITNYLMFKYGQPLHAFDLNLLKLDNDKLTIGVRLAKKDETLTLIDDKTIKLHPKDLVIENVVKNDSEIVALAGVMGGKPTEINADTTDILIEAANFDMFSIRATPRIHGIRSEASLRMEKGIDPELTLPSLQEAIYLITGHKDYSAIIDNYQPLSKKPPIITIDHNDINYYLNISQDIQKTEEKLELLGFDVKVNKNLLSVTVPSFRKDIKLKEDVYEEVGRHYNYNNITPTLPLKNLQPATYNKMWRFKNQIRSVMTRLGTNEILQYSFVDEEKAKVTSTIVDNEVTLIETNDILSLKLKNAMSPETAYMRASLIPTLSESVIENAKRFTDFTLFEINPVTIPRDNNLPDEPEMLSIIHYQTAGKQLNVMLNTKSVWKTLMQKLNANNSFSYAKTS